MIILALYWKIMHFLADSNTLERTRISWFGGTHLDDYCCAWFEKCDLNLLDILLFRIFQMPEQVRDVFPHYEKQFKFLFLREKAGNQRNFIVTARGHAVSKPK